MNIIVRSNVKYPMDSHTEIYMDNVKDVYNYFVTNKLLVREYKHNLWKEAYRLTFKDNSSK